VDQDAVDEPDDRDALLAILETILRLFDSCVVQEHGNGAFKSNSMLAEIAGRFRVVPLVARRFRHGRSQRLSEKSARALGTQSDIMQSERGGPMLRDPILIFLGAGLGGVLRHGVSLAAARAFGPAFPWGTLAINVLGSFLMGLLAGILALRAGAGWAEPARLLLATGLLGGFTTFSAFSLDAALLWERGDAGLAAAYVAASVVLSLLALAAGLWAVRVLTS
jgi:CrcB protein